MGIQTTAEAEGYRRTLGKDLHVPVEGNKSDKHTEGDKLMESRGRRSDHREGSRKQRAERQRADGGELGEEGSLLATKHHFEGQHTAGKRGRGRGRSRRPGPASQHNQEEVETSERRPARDRALVTGSTTLIVTNAKDTVNTATETSTGKTNGGMGQDMQISTLLNQDVHLVRDRTVANAREQMDQFLNQPAAVVPEMEKTSTSTVSQTIHTGTGTVMRVPQLFHRLFTLTGTVMCPARTVSACSSSSECSR